MRKVGGQTDAQSQLDIFQKIQANVCDALENKD